MANVHSPLAMNAALGRNELENREKETHKYTQVDGSVWNTKGPEAQDKTILTNFFEEESKLCLKERKRGKRELVRKRKYDNILQDNNCAFYICESRRSSRVKRVADDTD